MRKALNDMRVDKGRMKIFVILRDVIHKRPLISYKVSKMQHLKLHLKLHFVSSFCVFVLFLLFCNLVLSTDGH